MIPSIVRIRDACVGDLDALCALLAILFEQEQEFHPDAARQRAGLSALLAEPARSVVLVADANGEALGMVTLLYTVSTAAGARAALLEDLVVAPAARGRGIGRSLLRTAIDRARADGCARVSLLTDHDNAGAHRLYSSEGFVRSSMVTFRRALP